MLHFWDITVYLFILFHSSAPGSTNNRASLLNRECCDPNHYNTIIAAFHDCIHLKSSHRWYPLGLFISISVYNHITTYSSSFFSSLSSSSSITSILSSPELESVSYSCRFILHSFIRVSHDLRLYLANLSGVFGWSFVRWALENKNHYLLVNFVIINNSMFLSIYYIMIWLICYKFALELFVH